ncbi:hypothetical protein, partial [Burkholderia sp. SIMBA_019]|uniref:hypothetical protein n=1 Tax=Burkholderia sp. SIMBA_019 TaxID=3085765 RepID=UPI00397B63D0
MKVGHRQAFIAQNPIGSRLWGFVFAPKEPPCGWRRTGVLVCWVDDSRSRFQLGDAPFKAARQLAQSTS